MTRSAALLPSRFVATFLAAALVGLLACVPAPAQPPPAQPPTGSVATKTEIFRRSLDLLDFKTLKSFGDLDPNTSILIMLGDTRRLTEVPGGLEAFLRKGGAALIASDQPMAEGPKAALVDASGVLITGYTWEDLPEHKPKFGECYHGLKYCPFVVSRDSRFMRHPKNPNVWLSVATNLPSTLRFDGPHAGSVPAFAMVPDKTPFMTNDGRKGDISPLLGVAGDVGAGRIIVLADHSIFIDEMMKPKDNGNVEFTANCLTYLRGERGQRRRVLFVDDGVIGQRNPFDHLNEQLNAFQDHLEVKQQDDGLNKGLYDLVTENDRDRVRKLVKVSLSLATFILLMYGCYRLGIASRFRLEPGVPSLARAVQQQAPRGGLLQLRHEGLLDAGTVWETGRQLARDTFEAGGVPAPHPYHEPAVRVSGVGWWRRSQVRRRVLQLWRLAFLNKPIPLAPHALRALAAELETLKADLKRGTIQLT